MESAFLNSVLRFRILVRLWNFASLTSAYVLRIVDNYGDFMSTKPRDVALVNFFRFQNLIKLNQKDVKK